MKITKRQLRKIIKEEVHRLVEQSKPPREWGLVTDVTPGSQRSVFTVYDNLEGARSWDYPEKIDSISIPYDTIDQGETDQLEDQLHDFGQRNGLMDLPPSAYLSDAEVAAEIDSGNGGIFRDYVYLGDDMGGGHEIK
jgi:hypothetical protein